MKEHKIRPTTFADQAGMKYSFSSDEDHKKSFGQYLTPVNIADFMASLRTQNNNCHIDILDPGIGSGILSAALIEQIAKTNKCTKSINLVGYETDSGLLSTTKESLEYLKKWLYDQNIIFSFEIRLKDFIIDNAYVFEDNQPLFSEPQSEMKQELFDIIISNPPYFKISKDDPRSRATARIIYGQPNIYALFMAISARLLNIRGELIFITPRSYTSGAYFKSFREFFFSKVVPVQFHLFNSRTEAFNRDAILQENIIVHAKQNKKNEKNPKVTISFSNGSKDLTSVKKRILSIEQVIDLSTTNKVISLPITEEDDRILKIVDSWNGNLHSFDMEISTGKVVPFRAVEHTSENGNISKDEAPLIWMNNIRNFDIIWPFIKKNKPQYIHVSPKTMPLLNRNKNYVLLRRFSPKKERSRLKSSPFLKDKFSCDYVAFENHVNYIYRPKGDISKTEAIGISAILNSSCLDTYFRISNGNTQVSATEIRDIPLPDISIIKNLGNAIESGAPVNVDEYLLSQHK